MRVNGNFHKFIFIILVFFILSYFSKNSHFEFLTENVQVTDSNLKIENSKYIQFECIYHDKCGGWGDRLKGMLSTYALALLTNRTFLIKITVPFVLGLILEPNQVTWDKEINPYLAQSRAFSSKLFKIDWNEQFSNDLKNIDLLKYNSDVNLLRINGGLMFVNSFSKNRYLTERIKNLGYEPDKFNFYNLMHPWYEKLFKLNPMLEKRYQLLLKQAKQFKNSKLICVQIRIGGKNDNFNDRTFAKNNDSILFWDFLRKKFSIQISQNNYKIFLTTDKAYIKTEALQYFPNNKILFLNDSSFHLDKDFADNNENFNAAEDIILDFHMLQNCDYGVVSHSSFGLLGLWNRKEPFKNLYVFTPRDQKELEKNYEKRENLHFMKLNRPDDIFFL